MLAKAPIHYGEKPGKRICDVLFEFSPCLHLYLKIVRQFSPRLIPKTVVFELAQWKVPLQLVPLVNRHRALCTRTVQIPMLSTHMTHMLLRKPRLRIINIPRRLFGHLRVVLLQIRLLKRRLHNKHHRPIRLLHGLIRARHTEVRALRRVSAVADCGVE